MAKVVYNDCYGGFGISWDGARALVEELIASGRGGDARQLQSAMDEEWAGDDSELAMKHSDFMRRHGCFCAGRMFRRHDPALVAVVERIGKAANGRCASLAIIEIGSDVYRIDDYDGNESVVTPDGYEWQSVAATGLLEDR